MNKSKPKKLTERERFSKWTRTIKFTIIPLEYNCEKKYYYSTDTELMWMAWKAARRIR